MAECIYSNSINKSILTSGFTIPIEKWEIFEKSIGTSLSKGEKKDIVIWLGERKYDATYTNVNLKGENAARTVYQIRYTDTNGLVSALRRIYSPNSNDYDAVGGKIEIYAKNLGEIEFKCYPEVMVDPAKANNGINTEGKGMSLKSVVENILNGYVVAKKETFAGHQMGSFFRTDIPLAIYGTGIVPSAPYLITGSVGQGNWAMIPWVCIFDRKVTTTATKGIYIVYLLSKDGSSLYISFNQGCTDIRKTHTKRETIEIMHQKAEDIRARIDARGFRADNDAKLGDGLTELGELYEEGMIFYKEYKKGNVPEEAELREDLQKMMDIYQEYVSENSEDKWWPLKEEYDPNISKQKWIEILSDEKYVTDNLLNVLARYYDIGGHASVRQMVMKYGETDNFYKMSCLNLAKKLIDEQICPEPKLGDDSRRWPVLFLGRTTKENEIGDYVWRLRPELKEALEEINILQYLKVREGEEQLSTKETIEHIKKYISAKGFTFEEGLVENYYLSLKSKPFVILAGTSGTGKTRLVRLFAEAIGATSQNGRYKLVSVRPDWSDSSDLFGHVNLNDKFIPGAIIDFVKQAELDSRNPYFLCLDEMNLARVEYYLSDILSIIETREYVDGKVATDPLITENYYGVDAIARGKYGVVRIPENLYIIGTVNMDETTFPFSRKVLDRANTIEFSTVELLVNFDSTGGETKPILADNTFMKADYVFLNQCATERNFVGEVCIELQDINKILEKANAHVGYRVRDEIVFYMVNNKNSDNLLTRNEAFDHEIMQKILPRIQGSSTSVKTMLCELFKYCAGDYESYQTESDNISAKMMAAANKETCKYTESAKKIAFMVRRFEEDGFTAYWL